MNSESPQFNYSIPTSAYLIGQIYWLKKIRKENSDPSIVRGINLSITILLCTYIESGVNEILGAVLKKRIKLTEDDSYKRLLVSLESQLSRGTWTTFIDLSKTILPNPLNHYSDNETWKGISILFQLRNQLVHGKRIEATIQVKNTKLEMKYQGVYAKVLEYFKEQRVIRSNELKSTSHKILSTRTTNHFIKISDKFVDELFRNISEEQKTENLGEFMAFKLNIMADFGLEIDRLPRPNPISKKNLDDLPF